MKVAIRTAGKKGHKIREICSKYIDVDVVAYVDQNINITGTLIEGVPVVSIFEANELYKNNEIQLFLLPADFFTLNSVSSNRNMMDDMYDELISMGIDETAVRVSNFPVEDLSDNEISDFEADFVTRKEFYHLMYIEVPVAYHCNLNCKGCSHFSPLCRTEFPRLSDYVRDLEQLKKYIKLVHRIRLLGGEPFLNKELDRYIKETRRIYPQTDLRVVTNGLLLLSLDDYIYDVIKENDVTIDVTIYPILWKKADEIFAFLQKKGIKYTFYNCHEFVSVLSNEKKKFPFNSTRRTCIYYYLAEGTISTCMTMHDIKYYNEHFGTNWPGKEALIDLYDPNLTSATLIKRLEQVYPLCENCVQYNHMSIALDSVYKEDIRCQWDMYTKDNPPKESDWFVDNE